MASRDLDDQKANNIWGYTIRGFDGLIRMIDQWMGEGVQPTPYLIDHLKALRDKIDRLITRVSEGR